MKRKRNRPTLQEKYPPSDPCECETCRQYCARPGWWTVRQAELAMLAGYAHRMMLEIAPDGSFGVLSPAFRGCEQGVALQAYAGNGCNFFTDGLCELHGTGHEPLECLYCHHLRQGMGARCHADIQRDWRTQAGQVLVQIWIEEARVKVRR